MLLERKISVCPHSSELTSKKGKVNKIFIKGVNPKSFSGKLYQLFYQNVLFALKSNKWSEV